MVKESTFVIREKGTETCPDCSHLTSSHAKNGQHGFICVEFHCKCTKDITNE